MPGSTSSDRAQPRASKPSCSGQEGFFLCEQLVAPYSGFLDSSRMRLHSRFLPVCSMRLSFLTHLAWMLVLCPALLPAGEPHWVEARSDHFSVITDAGEK